MQMNYTDNSHYMFTCIIEYSLYSQISDHNFEMCYTHNGNNPVLVVMQLKNNIDSLFNLYSLFRLHC